MSSSLSDSVSPNIAPEIAIDIQNLTKTYHLYNSNKDRLKEALHPLRRKYHHDFYALKDISFSINKGETVGIVGKNGSGKSTLLKIITGVLTPTSGTVTVNGKVSALLELGAGFNPELSGIDNIYFNGTLMGYSRAEMDAKLEDIMAFADIGEFVHQPVKSYSSGMFVRLAFSVATVVDPAILIVDEALSVGDVFFQQKCYMRLKELKESGVTIVFVTHNVGDVVQFCSRGILLNNNELGYIGDSSETVKRYLLIQQQGRLESYTAKTDRTINHCTRTPDDISDIAWPQSGQFLNLDNIDIVASEIASCSAVALCSKDGIASRMFTQGDTISIYCEFILKRNIEVPIAGFIIKNEQNILVHGKNSLHYDELELPAYITKGELVRYRFDVILDISPGDYTFDIGLATITKQDYDERIYTSPVHTQAKTLRLCNLTRVGSFTVLQKPIFEANFSSLHVGICNLLGSSSVSVVRDGKCSESLESAHITMPTIFHVTHWKAGSQWIKNILKELAPDSFIESKLGVSHFLHDTIREGMIYPTLYVTRNQFDSVTLPGTWHRFVVIRDLRDTLISGYFSLKVSHAPVSSGILSYREKLVSLDVVGGLIYLMDEWLHLSADIQQSWLDANEEIIKYEDLINNDVEILSKILIDKCQMAVSRDRLNEVVVNNRFEQITGGRKSGIEDVFAHERKGVAGDWQNYFTPEVKEYFKAKFGELLIATGYESDNDW